MPRKLSAKDKAFESERASFRKKIREKDTEINILKKQLTDTQNEVMGLKKKSLNSMIGLNVYYLILSFLRRICKI